MDRFNRLSLGPGSIQYAVNTQDWKVRFFLALLAISETNAYLITNTMLKRNTKEPLDHVEFKKLLADALIFSPHRKRDLHAPTNSSVPDQPWDIGEHCFIRRSETRTNLVCVVCQKFRRRDTAIVYGSGAPRTNRSHLRC